MQKMGRVKNWLMCLVCSGGDDDMRTKQNYQILTFHTTTAAMAMEDYCHEQKIPGRLIPLPQGDFCRLRACMAYAAGRV